jgi:carboxymethylenebutenolidase
MGQHVQLSASDGHTFDAYVVQPATRDFSAVVVIQEIFGVNRHIRCIVDDYATQGFLAIAPALFDRAKRGVELDYTQSGSAQGMQLISQIGMDNAVLDVSAAITYGAQLAPSKKVGVVGFCLGGTLAWLSATRLSAKAAVCYYGGRISNYAAEQPRCPVMLHFGARDKHIPSSEIDKIQHVHPGLPIFLYEDAGHGFNCDQRADYNPTAASLARERTLAFLRSHL